jgi:cytoskeletal protein RodZ
VAQQQVEAFATVGSMLKSARLEHGFSEREVASRLKIVPEYVGLLEDDKFHALRSPSFARGYVRAYGRLVELNGQDLLSLFDAAEPELAGVPTKRVVTRQLQLQKTGLGVMVGLGVLVLLVAALWWWRGDSAATGSPDAGLEAAISKPGELAFAPENEG